MFSGYESPTEEEQLRAIWNEVNVGATGFLDRNELSVVCDHIGMDSMNEQVCASYKNTKDSLCFPLFTNFLYSISLQLNVSKLMLANNLGIVSTPWWVTFHQLSISPAMNVRQCF